VQDPVIADSARKHGVADDDMLHAWRNQVGARYYDDGFTMVVGPDRAGNLREVGTVDADDGMVIVHAMQARPSTLREVLGG
jgi:transposase-like protein